MEKQKESVKNIVNTKTILGYRGQFRNNIFLHYDNSKVIYPAGHNVIIYDPENKSQQILNGITGSVGINCMSQSSSRKYICWAEETEQTGLIVVYDVQSGKKKLQVSLETRSTKYISLLFGREEKILVSLTGGPEHMVVIWDWTKQKPLISHVIGNYALNGLFHHPKEDDSFCVMGSNYFKTFKISGDHLKSKELKESPNTKKDSKDYIESPQYLSSCIREESLVLGTANGELLYFNTNCEYKMQLSSSPFENKSIEVIIPYSKGFIIGTINCSVYVYERNEGDPKKPYIKTEKKFIHPEVKSKVVSLLLTNGEENLIIGLENGQILQVHFSLEREMMDENNQTDYYNKMFYPLVQNFHTDTITGLDTCIRKQLFVTCSLDKTVRLWDYIENRLEICQKFDEQALSVAFHPSGMHLVVGLSNRIKLMNILEKKLECFKEINYQNCNEIVFSNGGQYFAISNVNIIHVYNFYSGDNPGNMVYRGHSGKVMSINWQWDDSGFYSCSQDGVVNEFRLENSSQKVQLLNENGLEARCVLGLKVDNEYRVYVSGNLLNNGDQQDDQKAVYEITYKKQKQTLREQTHQSNEIKIEQKKVRKIYTNGNVGQILISQHKELIMMGLSEQNNGSIRVSQYPINDDEIAEYQVHSKRILRMKMNIEETHLFSVGEDGLLVIYEIKDRMVKKEQSQGMAVAEEFLMSSSKYYKKIGQIDRLRKEIEEVRVKNEKDIRIAMQEKEQRMDQLQDQINRDNYDQEEKFNKLDQEKIDMETNYKNKKQELKEVHQNKKKYVENEYKVKIQMEENRFQELQKQKMKESENYNKYMEELQYQQKEEIRKMKEKYMKQLLEETELIDQLTSDSSQIQSKFDNKREYLEVQAEEEINRMKEDNDSNLKQMLAQMDDAEMQKRTKNNQYDNEVQKLESETNNLKETLENIQNQQEQNRQYTKEKESKLKDIEERDKTIRDKKRRIFDLLRKTQELEKFKFVLDYKIKELKRDIGPREEEISKMKEQIYNMNAEILHFSMTNENLSLIVTDLMLKHKGMKNEYEKLEQNHSKNSNYIRQFESDVNELKQYLGNFKSLKKQMLKLYNKYVQQEKNKVEGNVDQQMELINQRGQLESAILGFKKNFADNIKAHKQDNNRIMKENVGLIREINDLKREIKIQKDFDAQQTKPKHNKQDQKSNRRGANQDLNQVIIRIDQNQEDINRLQRMVEDKQSQIRGEQRPISSQRVVLDPLSK